MALIIKVEENKPRVFVVSLAGALDSTTYPELESKIAYLLAEGEAKVITLDLDGLEFISSMGLRVIFKARKDLSRAGGYLCLARISPPVQKALAIIEALPSMQIFSSYEEMDAYLAKVEKQ